jgi:hypothetical protein
MMQSFRVRAKARPGMTPPYQTLAREHISQTHRIARIDAMCSIAPPFHRLYYRSFHVRC